MWDFVDVTGSLKSFTHPTAVKKFLRLDSSTFMQMSQHTLGILLNVPLCAPEITLAFWDCHYKWRTFLFFAGNYFCSETHIWSGSSSGLSDKIVCAAWRHTRFFLSICIVFLSPCPWQTSFGRNSWPLWNSRMVTWIHQSCHPHLGKIFNFNSNSVAADAEECDCFAAALDFLPPSPSSPQQREEPDLVSLARQASKRRRAPSQCSD